MRFSLNTSLSVTLSLAFALSISAVAQTPVTGFHRFVPPGQKEESATPEVRSAAVPIAGGRAVVQAICHYSTFQEFGSAYLALAGTPLKQAPRPQMIFSVLMQGAKIDVGQTPRLRGTYTAPDLQAPDRGEPLTTTKQQAYDFGSWPVSGFSTQIDDAPKQPSGNFGADGSSITFLVTPPSAIAAAHRVRIYFDVRKNTVALSVNLRDPQITALVQRCDAIGDNLQKDFEAQQAAIKAKQDAIDATKASIKEIEDADRSLPATTVDPSKLVQVTGAKPAIPPIAKAAHISGTVVLHVTISRIGTVLAIHAISGPSMLQSAAVSAVQGWTFEPVLIDGRASKVESDLSISFHY